ncbi:hypothetical protein V6N12_029934 [Hibiscus sabdariffa]|uniref:Disease resistance protein RGA3 n=1 Tax=Hibiscus sabdariffa TaxID=183260 RepID=A0ABR2CZ92_9ROSI
MAETYVGAVLEAVLSKVIPVTAEQINLAWGLKDELTRLGQSLELIKAFLQDAEERRTKNNLVKLWLQRLKAVAYEAEDVLDECSYEILRRKVEIRNQIGRKVLDFFSPSNSIAFRFNMANKIKDILKSLDDLNKLANQFGLQQIVADDESPVLGRSNVEAVSFLDDSNIVGRKTDVSKVVGLLVNPKDDQVVSVVPIVGPGGLGKTTLAKLVYNDVNVQRHFDVRIWVCVSNDFDVKRILKEMLDHFPNQHTLISDSMNAIVQKLKEKMEEAKGEKEHIRYLLVLDDLWSVEKWEELKLCLIGISENGGNGVIVTTRNQSVASAVQVFPDRWHQAGRLEDDECWSIIKERASRGSPMPRELELIGMEIAKQCQGVPLIAKVIAGTMRNVEMSRGAWLNIQTSDIWDSVESVLKLSFDRLFSSSLKKCFAYCAMFSKDYCFEKDQLIQLWMAEGFLGSSMAMVDIGNKYLNELLSNSLFQEVEKDACGNILTFKMHDLVHDLALSVSKSDTLVFQENSTFTMGEVSHIWHLSIGCEGESLATMLTTVAPKLHSLFSEIDLFKKLSRTFTSLRVLKFSGANYTLKLPTSLGELKHLRYFDISKTFIRALPESITKLYNLQTLRLLGLWGLTLPDRLRDLISLKHLYFDRQELQPVNIGNLSCLQILPIFFVDSERGHRIEELGCLNELHGELRICNLQHVTDKQEANGANLHCKEKLCKVILEWRWTVRDCNSEQVMEGLQPHSNLQSLIVSDYPGKSFPSWMLRPVHGSSTGLFLLDNLMELELINCKCTSLPPLGQLQNLQFLKLRNLVKVECMGNEFHYGQSSDGKNEVIKVFPALKVLTLQGMQSLKEWTTMATTNTIMFPCLEELGIFECPLLKSVPLTGQCSSLEKLHISRCTQLSKIGDGLSTSTCLKELFLYQCPDLSSIPDMEGFSSLRNVSVDSCNKLEVLSVAGRCSSLEKLWISECRTLSKIGDGLFTATCLEELTISDLPHLISIPEGLGRLHSLYDLTIMRCPRLSSIPGNSISSLNCLRKLTIGGFSGELQEFPGLSASLRVLHLIGWKRLKSLPHQLQLLTALEELTIEEFQGMKTLPEWLGTLSSLKLMQLISCHNLMHLPSVDVMRSLSNLERFYITKCLLLEPRCAESGPEWSKISHIPEIITTRLV